MTRPDNVNPPTAEQSQVVKRGVAIATATMNDEQFRRFVVNMQKLQDIAALTNTQALGSKCHTQDRSTGHRSEDTPHAQLTASVYAWLSETLDDYLELSPRNHAAKALREFLDPPCPRDELLAFFKAFADAYQQLLTVRTELIGNPSDIAPATENDLKDKLSLSAVRKYPDRVKYQLTRLMAYSKKSPDAAELFKLVELAGCSASELALYFALPEEVVARRIEFRRYEIFESTSEI
jgi:hypothetical protein